MQLLVCPKPAKIVTSYIRPAAAESFAQFGILMRELQNVLGETGRLDHASDLDGALVFDQPAHCLEEKGRELVDERFISMCH